MARRYLEGGERIEASCELTLLSSGEWEYAGLVQGCPRHVFREDGMHPDGGEWFLVRYDLEGSRGTNPRWGTPFFDDEHPDY